MLGEEICMNVPFFRWRQGLGEGVGWESVGGRNMHELMCGICFHILLKVKVYLPKPQKFIETMT